jgi:hypothetical protein
MTDLTNNPLERFLKREGSLNRLYREIPAEDPPSTLDDAILAASRRAVQARPRKVFSPFSQGWRFPFAVAASVLISVTLVVLMQEQRDMSPTDEAPVPGAKPVMPAEPPAPAITPIQPQSPDSTSSAMTARPEREEADRAAAALPPAASMPSQAIGEGARVVRENASSEPAAIPTMREAPQLEAAPVPAPASAPVAPRLSMPTSEAPREEARGRELMRKRDQPRAAPEAKGLVAPLDEEAKRKNTEDISPQRWLADIQTLRQQHRESEARASLVAFRKRYPDYPLSEELRAWESDR